MFAFRHLLRIRNLIRLGVLLPFIASAVHALPAVPQRKEMVGAYYYPWYFPGKWADLKAQLTPTLGFYQTDSMPIVVKHIDSASYYGIDCFFMSWWNPNDVTDKHLKNGFMKAPNNNKMKFAMVVEPLGVLDTLDGKRDGVVDFDSAAVVKAWIDIFKYFKTSFFDHPSYLHVDGKPVVLVYVTRTFKNFGTQYLDSLYANVGNVYIMADEAFIDAQSDPATARNGIRNRFSVFPSYVSYNSYEATLIKPGDSAITYQQRVAMPYYTNWATKTVFHPPIMPYYQDFRDGHPPLPGSADQFRTVIKQIRGLPQWAPAGDSLNRIYMVTSWNEWFEGTSVEPSVEKGNKPLQVLREAFVNQGTTSRAEPVKIAKETTLRLKSVYKSAYVCVEKTAAGNVSARAACDPKGDPLVLVDLGNNEVALRDPSSGKYLSVYSDSLVYPLSDYIGTWEIFTLVPEGNNIALQSKKTGGFLKPSVAADAPLIVSGGFDTDALLTEDLTPVTAIGRKDHPLGPAFSFSFSGRELRVVIPEEGHVHVTLSDTRGRALARDFARGGTYSLGEVPDGVHVLTVESSSGLRRAILAPR